MCSLVHFFQLQASNPTALPTYILLGSERQCGWRVLPLTGAEGSGQIPIWFQQVPGGLVWWWLQGTGAGAGAGHGSRGF